MGLFRASVPIDRDEYEWLIACFAWLRTVLDDGAITPSLVLPDNPALTSAGTARELFEAVRSLMGMEQWGCRLEQVEVDDSYDPAHHTEPVGVSACGTFSVEGGQAVIRYSSAMLRNPDALAGTFAHELCHYLLAEAGDPPGGPDLMEHSTDCAAAYCGFGVLLANSARQFEQWSDGTMFGWQASTAGYLSENALVTASALFAGLHGYEAANAKLALKPYLERPFMQAHKAVTRDFPDLSAHLAKVDLLDWQYA